jgi:CAF1 family ribonuclease
MEITDQNFVQSIALVKKSIANADFIAFDTEFSGKLP